jgi:hypothetical protein
MTDRYTFPTGQSQSAEASQGPKLLKDIQLGRGQSIRLYEAGKWNYPPRKNYWIIINDAEPTKSHDVGHQQHFATLAEAEVCLGELIERYIMRIAAHALGVDHAPDDS